MLQRKIIFSVTWLRPIRMWFRKLSKFVSMKHNSYEFILSILTCNFSLSHTESYYVKWNYAIFNGSYGGSTYLYLQHKMIDPLDPPGLLKSLSKKVYKKIGQKRAKICQFLVEYEILLKNKRVLLKQIFSQVTFQFWLFLANFGQNLKVTLEKCCFYRFLLFSNSISYFRRKITKFSKLINFGSFLANCLA